MLEILERFHSLGYIHNDMKPQNIMTKLPNTTEVTTAANQIYLIDFGLAIQARDSQKYKFRGTPYFASNNSLERQGSGPKDDIESLLYILVYFYHGQLPWNRDLPVLRDDVVSTMQIQSCI